LVPIGTGIGLIVIGVPEQVLSFISLMIGVGLMDTFKVNVLPAQLAVEGVII
jgi:hypothetical protein